MGDPVLAGILGPPGSGQHTQARIHTLSHNLDPIPLNRLLKLYTSTSKKRKHNFVYRMEGRERLDRKSFGSIVSKYCGKASSMQGFLLEGFPNTKGQAQFLWKYAKSLQARLCIIEIMLPDEEVILRLNHTLKCYNCLALYHELTSPPQQKALCDYCKKPLHSYGEEGERVLKLQLRQYRKQMEEVVPFCEKKGCLYKINGMLPKDEVVSQIDLILEKN